MAYRRGLIEILTEGPRTASSLARALGLDRRDIEDDLRHVVKSARAAGKIVVVDPARCKSCGFVFDEARLDRPGKCPACRGTRIFEPLISIRTLGRGEP